MKFRREEPTDPSRREFIKLAGAAVLGGANIEEQSQENKFINKDGNCELPFLAQSAKEAHDSANLFSNEVGDALKKAYPSRILRPNVTLGIVNRNGKKLYRLIWSCQIVKASEAEADWYFDRAGTILSGKTLKEAKDKVEDELNKSQKVPVMRAQPLYKGKGKIYDSFIKDSFAGNERDGYWYIKEFFLVAPK